jgi:hypothetical protein
MKTASVTRALFRYAFATVAVFAFTQSVSALTISPARMDLSGDPGKVVSGEFILTNEQPETQTFYTSAQNFEAQGETGTPNFVDSTDGLATWISLIDQVTLKPNQQTKVHFTVTIPKDADAGGHFAAIFLTTNPPHATGGQVAVGAKIGMLVLLHVSGDIKESGGIVGFETKSKAFISTMLPVTFVYRFANSGNDRVNPAGEITVRDIVGLTAMKLNANPGVGNVLPGSTRRFEVAWGPSTPLSLNAGFFETAWYEAKNFAFGFYRANLQLGYGVSSSDQSSVSLFIFPWQLIIVVVVLLYIIWFLFRRGIKRYNRWIISQAQFAMQNVAER